MRATQIQPQSLGLGTNPAWQCHRSRTPKVPRASPPAHPPALACCDFQIKPSFSRARAPLTPLCLCASPEVTARASSCHSPGDTARVPLPTTAALPATHSPGFPLMNPAWKFKLLQPGELSTPSPESSKAHGWKGRADPCSETIPCPCTESRGAKIERIIPFSHLGTLGSPQNVLPG